MTLDEWLHWLQTSIAGQAFARAHVLMRPVDLDDYRELWLKMGAAVPASLDTFVSRCGLVEISGIEPCSESGVPGFRMDDEKALFESYLHTELSWKHGVPRSEHWILFATEAGDLDGAYAVDLRFPDSIGTDFAVGHYHQDVVCTNPIGEREPLPRSHPTFLAFLQDYVTRSKDASERGATERDQLTTTETTIATEQRAVVEAMDASFAAGTLEWPAGYTRGWLELVRTTPRAQTVEKVLAHIRSDFLVGRGPFTVGAKVVRRGGSWPYESVGPLDLFYRLPTEGPWGRRRTALWALQEGGLAPSHPELRAAIEFLTRWIGTGDDAECRDHLVRCARSAWITRCIPPNADGCEIFFARALAWLLGRNLSAPQAHYAAMTGVNIGHILERPVCFTAWELFEKLEAILLGRPEDVPYRLRSSRPVQDSPELIQLETWLADPSQSQRDKLDQLASLWVPRLRALDSAERMQARRLICRGVNSKKLTVARDKLLLDLD